MRLSQGKTEDLEAILKTLKKLDPERWKQLRQLMQ
jgi:hypothetical protein